MKITLVRHGEVTKKYLGKYNGHIDIELSANGLQQVLELGEELQKNNYDKIYCSDLLRARQTLEEFKLGQEVVYTQELREKYWGRHEGKSFEEISKEGIVYENFEQWISSLDGESIFDFEQRVKEYFNEIILANI